MRVNQMKLTNFRSFAETGPIILGSINVLIGENNSGKSSIIRAIRYLQQGIQDRAKDVRAGTLGAAISLDICTDQKHPKFADEDTLNFVYELKSNDRASGQVKVQVFNPVGLQIFNQLDGNIDAVLPSEFINREPSHFLVPFLSKRKGLGYNPSVASGEAASVQPEFSNLPSKVSRLSAPSFPGYELYSRACKEILGYEIASTPHQNGQMPGLYLEDTTAITIEQMGDGVPSILFLLSQLATSKKKVFLIEELENDLHPNALKALLDLIEQSATENENQFVISTHSNIVVTRLASIANAKLFRITSDKTARIPTSTIEELEATTDERVQVLQDLGYALSDFHLHEGWLIFEETSAESICRDYLIPWFTPELKRIKTISARGVNSVPAYFSDVSRLVLFTHIMPIYKSRTWVLVDGDTAGNKVVTQLRSSFKHTPSDRFNLLDKDAFERYYPTQFQADVDRVLAIQDKTQRQHEKNELRVHVVDWISSHPEDAKSAFLISAANVIEKLQEIEQAFLAQTSAKN
jgi:predicted ATPase